MRYLGLDYGTKRIGVAISDEDGGFAFSKETIPNDVSATDRIARIVREENIKEIVMGDTRMMGGEPNSITEDSDFFARTLEEHIKVPVHREREAWSTQEAARYAPKGKMHDDAAAAAIILQRFLDKRTKKD